MPPTSECADALSPPVNHGRQTMAKQYQAANQGSNDAVLELHEFLVFLIRVSFYRANPRYGATRRLHT